MAETHLRLTELTRSFGTLTAVRGISLDVARGEILGLLGPNGAGKSTTINILTGFLRPSSGDVLWEGRSIFAHMAQWRKAIGVVLEDLSLFEYLTVEEHLRLVGRLYGLSPAETGKRTGELLDFLRLGEFAGTVVREASHGTRKKLAFGLAVIHGPRFLFLDEALNGIDAIVVKDIKDLLRRMARGGVTIVLSSHILDSAETLIDRCLIIAGGAVALDEPLERITASGRSLEETYAKAVSGSAGTAVGLSWVS
jgi:ABC-2 type transport system ATP-binding protein